MKTPHIEIGRHYWINIPSDLSCSCGADFEGYLPSEDAWFCTNQHVHEAGAKVALEPAEHSSKPVGRVAV